MTTVERTIGPFDFSSMHERMQFYIDQNILPCCNTLVMKGLDVVDFKTYGYMDLENRRPLREDAIFRMYSNTKLVTSVAAMMLYEANRYGLEDPLSEYLPEFKQPRVLKRDAQTIDDALPAEGPILIKHILSHSAGLSYGFIEPQSVIDRAYGASGVSALNMPGLTLESLCAKLASMPLAYEPGTQWRYSLAADVTARLVEVLSGQSFDAFLRQRIFEPLGMHDTGFHVPESKHERFTTMYAPTNFMDPMHGGLIKVDDPAQGAYSRPPSFQSGGGGLVSTVSDYLAFVRMLLNQGEWNGARLLKPETLTLMRTNQLPPNIRVQIRMWKMPNTVFGLGFGLRTAPVEGEPASVTGEHFWGGMAGTHTWMSPAANLTGMCMTQRMPGFWHPFSHEFRDLAYRIAGER